MVKTRKVSGRKAAKGRHGRKKTRKMRGGDLNAAKWSVRYNLEHTLGLSNLQTKKIYNDTDILIRALYILIPDKCLEGKIKITINKEELKKKINGIYEKDQRIFKNVSEKENFNREIENANFKDALDYLIKILRVQKGKNTPLGNAAKLVGKFGRYFVGNDKSALSKNESIAILQSLHDSEEYEGKACTLFYLRVRLERMLE